MKMERYLLFLLLLSITCLIGCSEPTEASDCYNSVPINPNSKNASELNTEEEKEVRFHKEQARMFGFIGENPKALEEIDLILNIVSDDFDTYLMGAMFHAEINEYRESLSYASQAIKIDPFGWVFIKSMYKYQMENSIDYFSDELACLDSAIESNSGDPKVFENRGMFFFTLGYSQHALSDYLKVLELEPHNDNVMFFASFTLMDLERYSEAEEMITSAIVEKPNNWEYYQLRGNIYELMNEISLAEADYKTMLIYCDTPDSCE